jgi:hypothetical protein
MSGAFAVPWGHDVRRLHAGRREWTRGSLVLLLNVIAPLNEFSKHDHRLLALGV